MLYRIGNEEDGTTFEGITECIGTFFFLRSFGARVDRHVQSVLYGAVIKFQRRKFLLRNEDLDVYERFREIILYAWSG